MTLLGYEWGKLFRMPALWGFLAVSLAFNCLLVGTGDRWRWEWNEASDIAGELGQRVDGGFLEGLEQRPPSDYRDGLIGITGEMSDIYRDYDLQRLSDFYADFLEGSPIAMDIMAKKYERLAARVEHLSRTGAAMDLYAGPVTHNAHQFLYGTLLRAILTEGAVLGMLSMLFLLGCEGQQRTAASVYASRTGRKTIRYKVLAGTVWALWMYLLLAAVSLGALLLFWDWRGIWNGSVSSQFNYVIDLLFRRPFFTWADFTAGSYLMAAICLGGLLTVVFSMLAAVCGTLMQNVYLSALVLILLLCGGMGAQAFCAQTGLWTGYALLTFQPASIWLVVNGWFTELGLNAFFPWQETVGTGAGAAAMGLGIVLSLKRFDRKDVLT